MSENSLQTQMVVLVDQWNLWGS